MVRHIRDRLIFSRTEQPVEKTIKPSLKSSHPHASLSAKSPEISCCSCWFAACSGHVDETITALFCIFLFVNYTHVSREFKLTILRYPLSLLLL